MGRSASHIALECAWATRPNLTLIGEERKSWEQIVGEVADLVWRRYEKGKEYGVVLIPEGLIEFVPELSRDLKVEKDPHGNPLLSQIQTEKILIEGVRGVLQKRGFAGKWNVQEHFLGYEGRSCLPTNFDANYGYALGLLAAVAVREGLSGVICAIRNLKEAPEKWVLKAVPIVQLMHLEMRGGKEKPVIQKALVDVKGKNFVSFCRFRTAWEIEDQYRYPGPIQFFGDPALTDSVPLSM